jgi:2-polyprenyl-3-methyl-5-hydroxy-6-metoxy-1,4-benzoquinol methylase
MSRGPILVTDPYQKITSDSGTAVAGSDRSYLNETIFQGSEFSGKTLLDIGCHHGYFCLEAARRGANSAVGIDAFEENVTVARALSDGLANVEYIEADFESWESEQQFDVVLCLNVLHHLYDPIHAIRKMATMAREKLVVEIAVPTLQDVLHRRLSAWALGARGLPAMFLRIPRNNVDVGSRMFLLTPAVLKVLLNFHSHEFEDVRISPSPFKKRWVVSAARRKIERLTIVAGPTSSGKSTFCQQLADDAALRVRLGLGESTPLAVEASDAGALPNRPLDHVLLQYDMLRPAGRGMRTYQRDPALSLIRCARVVDVLTIMTDASRLQAQFATNELNRAKRITGRLRKISGLYRDRRFLDYWYRQWFAYLESQVAAPGVRMAIENIGEFLPRPATQWRDIFDAGWPDDA